MIFAILTALFSVTLLILLVTVVAQAQNLAIGEESKPGVKLLQATSGGLIIEVLAPEFSFENLSTSSLKCVYPSIAGFSEIDTPGWPRLPATGVMVGIPPGSLPSLEIVDIQVETVAQSDQICPHESPILEDTLEGSIHFQGVEVVKDETVYGSDQFFPAVIAEITGTDLIRSQPVATLRFVPFQYNPVRAELRYVRRMVVRLNFHIDPDQLNRLNVQTTDEGPFEALLQSSLLNYEQARDWRIRPTSTTTVMRESAESSRPAFKIIVDLDGIYQLMYQELVNAQVPVDDIDPRTFHIHNQEQEAAIYVSGQEDGVFSAGEYILFYGEKVNTKFTDKNVYWLTWGGSNGKRMPVVDGEPVSGGTVPEYFLTTVRLEEDHLYQSKRPSSANQDHWYWQYIPNTSLPNPNIFSTTFDLHNLYPDPISATLRGLFRSFPTSPDHHTFVYINDHLVEEATWLADTEHYFEKVGYQSSLMEGVNTIKVQVPVNTSKYVFINWFELDYHDTYVAENDKLWFDGEDPVILEYHLQGFSNPEIWVFDVTDPYTPTQVLSGTLQFSGSDYSYNFEQQISGEHHYFSSTPNHWLDPVSIDLDTPSDLHAGTNGADYIIITHPDFYNNVLPLAAYRDAPDFRSMVVDVQDIYDEFSGGVFNPEAIHDFLAYTYQYWSPPAPSYILLVGDGNYDFKNNMGYGEPSYMPPYLAWGEIGIGETAVDNYYVTVSGAGILPDMFLGRFPVKTSQEAEWMVNKTIGYEQSPTVDGWNQNVLLAADNYDPMAGNFAAYSDNIAENFLPESYFAHKVYLSPPPPGYSGSGTFFSAVDARTEFQNRINQGALIVSYVGHAGYSFWADYNEQIFKRDDVSLLTNVGKLSFFVPMTCMDGYYIQPPLGNTNQNSTAETVVRADGIGAVASFSPTGYGFASGHDLLEKGLFKAIFTDGISEIGRATTLAKYYLSDASGGGYPDLVKTYMLFGDPATRLRLARRVYLPVIFK